MPAINPITIKDGESTPVSHVFTPAGFDANNVAIFKERNANAAIGWSQLSIQYRGPVKGGNGGHKISVKLTLPKAVTTTDTTGKSVVSVDYSNFSAVDFVVSEKSTQQDRKNTRVLMANALLDANIGETVDLLTPFY